MGSESGSHVMSDVAKLYESMKFELRKGRNSMDTSPRVLTDYLEVNCALRSDGSFQELNGFTAYPATYFDPLDSIVASLKLLRIHILFIIIQAPGCHPAKKFRVEMRKKLAPVIGPKLSWFISSVLSVLRFGRKAF